MNKRKKSARFACPKCKYEFTRVIMTTTMSTGPIVRRRECTKCEFRWYTGQEPEYLLPAKKVKYIDRGIHCIEEVE
jgi:transcriptional regulator NrdR family protein